MVITMIIAIIGISGRMGSKLFNFYKDKYEIVGVDRINFDKALTYKSLRDIPSFDLVIDFSSPLLKKELIYALENDIFVICGTTGYTDSDILEFKKINENKFFWSPNYAKGIQLFYRISKICKNDFKLLDFVEIHASTKKDMPSGTAKTLAKNLGIEQSKIQSVRLPYAPPIHELVFSSENERIILRHEVISTEAFIDGVDEKLKEVLEEIKNDKEIIWMWMFWLS